jgi:hypothetical protein
MAQQLHPIRESHSRHPKRSRRQRIEMTPEEVDAIKWLYTASSSNIHALAWHDEALWVLFEGAGRLYCYPKAEKSHYDALVEADEDEKASVGKTFHRTVKQGGLEYARVIIKEKEE